MAAALDTSGRLWVAWPKKASKVATDIDFGFAQGIGLDAGLVDNKSASITDVFQGLQFVYRVKDRPKALSGSLTSAGFRAITQWNVTSCPPASISLLRLRELQLEPRVEQRALVRVRLEAREEHRDAEPVLLRPRRPCRSRRARA